MKKLYQIILTFFLTAGLFFFAGCEGKDAGDHLEDAGESISDAAEETGDAISDATEETRETLKENETEPKIDSSNK